MKEKIATLVRRGLANDEKQAMRRQVAEKYNWDKIAEQTIGVYEKCSR